jgi:hypothetical protein
MMSMNSMGTYLSCQVLFQEAGNLGELAIKDLSHAVVLLWLGESSWGPEQLKIAIKRFAATKPLNITIAGTRSDDGFRILLETLSALPTNKHIMTGVLTNTDVKDPEEDSLIVKDAIKQFLIATWPDEERFEDWSEYQIIVIGRPDLSQQIRRSVLEILGK